MVIVKGLRLPMQQIADIRHPTYWGDKGLTFIKKCLVLNPIYLHDNFISRDQ
jgi:hypothetical protein